MTDWAYARSFPCLALASMPGAQSHVVRIVVMSAWSVGLLLLLYYAFDDHVYNAN